MGIAFHRVLNIYDGKVLPQDISMLETLLDYQENIMYIKIRRKHEAVLLYNCYQRKGDKNDY